MKTKTIRELSELRAVAEEVLVSLQERSGAQIITLTGDLGAGKTAFTKELAKLLGVEGEITSPTFVIMKSYEISSHPMFKKLTHIDAYRIESDDEMRVLGFEEILNDSSQLVCIEWPEKIEQTIPRDAYPVSLTLNLDETRTLTYGI
jgi:tRNA threonylcarbamoyladenosine biosynthesis protein TsaE